MERPKGPLHLLSFPQNFSCEIGKYVLSRSSTFASHRGTRCYRRKEQTPTPNLQTKTDSWSLIKTEKRTFEAVIKICNQSKLSEMVATAPTTRIKIWREIYLLTKILSKFESVSKKSKKHRNRHTLLSRGNIELACVAPSDRLCAHIFFYYVCIRNNFALTFGTYGRQYESLLDVSPIRLLTRKKVWNKTECKIRRKWTEMITIWVANWRLAKVQKRHAPRKLPRRRIGVWITYIQPWTEKKSVLCQIKNELKIESVVHHTTASAALRVVSCIVLPDRCPFLGSCLERSDLCKCTACYLWPTLSACLRCRVLSTYFIRLVQGWLHLVCCVGGRCSTTNKSHMYK